MYAAERQRRLVEIALGQGRVNVTQAAADLGVVTETIRRDLDALVAQGLLHRVHGGAIPAGFATLGDQPLSARDVSAVGEKEVIARAALQFLPDGDASILLDAGSSTGRLAALLPPDARFQVFTTSAPIAQTVSTRTECTVRLIGGRLRATTQSTVGNTDELGRLRVAVAFVGTNGLSQLHGLTTPDADEADAKRAMVRAGDMVVALVDSRKLGAVSTVRFAELGDLDVLVTDAGVSAHQVAAAESAGVRVVRAT